MENKKFNKKERLYLIIASLLAIIAIIVCVVLLLKQNGKIGKGDYGEPVNEKFSFLVDQESSLLKNDNIFSGQYKLYQDLLSDYKKEKHTIDNPYVKVNPFLTSPQTAIILFETNKSESVSVTIKGKHNDDLVINFEKSKQHILPIYGLYAEYDNKVIIKTSSGTKELSIKILDKAPTADVEVDENKITNSNGEFYFATSSLGLSNIAYDNYGEIRWWINIGYTKGMTMLKNGHLLLSSANEGPDLTSTSGVVEIDMLGFVHKEYEISGGYHHDGYELPNGNLIILTSKVDSESLADHIVEINRETGKVEKEWNLKDIVLNIDKNLLETGEITWGWINSVYYDEKTDALILSVRNQNSVVSIDYKTGNINWILGEKKYWTDKFEPYLLKGEGDDFIYPAGQHSVYINEDGNLSIFNNGYNAFREETVTCKSLKNNESYAMVYQLDIKNKKAKVLWKFGGKEYFSYALSSFTYSTNKHRIFNSGWHFTDKVNYDDPSCTQFSNDSYDAYIIDFDENNNIVNKLHVLEPKFEVIKANIYNLGSVSVNPKKIDTVSNYKVELGRYLSNIPSDKYEKLSEKEALEYSNSDIQEITFEIHNNRFSLVGYYTLDSTIDIVLISPRGNAYKYVLKTEGEEMKDFINLSELKSGKYYLFAKINGTMYNTTKYIEIP